MRNAGAVTPLPTPAPTPPSPLLDRPRLAALLDADRPLTLVVACAGSGKRTAVRGWLTARGHAALWVPAVAGRTDATRLAADVAAGSEGVRAVDLGREPPGPAIDPDDPAAVADRLRRALAHRGRALCLVLDAGGERLDPAAAALATALLREPAAGLRLLVVAGAAPDLPLSRLRLDGRLGEVGREELRFTPGEVAALLGLRAGPAAARSADVLAATGGWAAGVAAHATAAADAAAERDAPGSWLDRGRQLADEFAREEVLGPLDPVLRDALVRTAPLPELDPAVVGAALGGAAADGAAVVDALVAADLAQPTGEPGRVRARTFLRPLLARLRERELAAVAATAQARALAAACEAEGRVGDAVTLLTETGDEAGAVAVIGRGTDAALARDDWPRLERWLALLPEAVADRHAETLVARAWVSHLSGRTAPLPGIVDRVAELDADLPPDDPGRLEREGMAEIFRIATLVPIEADPASVLRRLEEVGRQIRPGNRYGRGLAVHGVALALQGLGRGDEAVARLTEWVAQEADRADAAYARGLQGLVFVHYQAGNLAAAARVAEELRAVADRHGLPVGGTWARRFLGRVAYEQGRLAEAADWFAAATADPAGNRACFAESTVGRAASLVAVGQAARGLHVVDDALRQATEARATFLTATLRAAQGVLAVRAGRAEPAEALPATVGAGLDLMSLHAQLHPVTARAELLLREGSPAGLDEAGRLVGALRGRAAGCRHVPALVVAEALAAALARARGEGGAAEAALGRAAALGVPAGTRQTFLDLAPLLRPALPESAPGAARSRELARVAAWLAADPAAARARSRPEAGGRPSPLELLTVREAEVLALLARRMTYQEIGDALSISAGTVKFHLGSVYGKLGVSGRRQALLRAADLGWDLAAPGR